MLGRGLLWILLMVLVHAGSVGTLLTENIEDWDDPTSFQKQCSAKCPELDLNQFTLNKTIQQYLKQQQQQQQCSCIINLQDV
ncbi:hypothetical protein M0804_012202 [Polistes exclamans]|nr:hypothetical protein M0804_012202 [Polistes exclamans]